MYNSSFQTLRRKGAKHDKRKIEKTKKYCRRSRVYNGKISAHSHKLVTTYFYDKHCLWANFVLNALIVYACEHINARRKKADKEGSPLYRLSTIHFSTAFGVVQNIINFSHPHIDTEAALELTIDCHDKAWNFSPLWSSTVR